MTVRKFSDGSHFNGTPKEQVPGNWTIENGPFIDDLPIKIWNTVNFLSFLYVYHICGWFIDDLPIKWGYNSPIFSGLLMGATKGRFERWNALNPVPRLTVPRYVAPCYGLFVYKLARPCMYSLYIYSIYIIYIHISSFIAIYNTHIYNIYIIYTHIYTYIYI